MKLKQVLIALCVFSVLALVSIRSYSQSVETVDVICLFNEKVPQVMSTFDTPFGAQHKKETVWRKTAPEGFHAVLALMQVVNVAPCPLHTGQEATLAIRAFRLIERDPAGVETVVSEVTDFRGQTRPFRFDGALYPRIPSWYNGSPSRPAAEMLTLEERALVINVAQSPQTIYHGWTDPKVTAKPGMNYLVEMEVKITGLARLQMGIDYWRETDSAYNEFDATCQKSNNCEGYLSRWFGPTKSSDWQTIRTPASF